MKKFIGTKIIEAKKMNRGDYNEYRGWKIPDNEDPKDEGWLVKYSDGYESWSPRKQFEEAYREFDVTKLPSTAALMQSDNYKERFIAEYKQLVIRYKGLLSMLKKWDGGKLEFTPTCPRSTYTLQVEAMRKYIAVLEARAVMEGIDLESEV